MLEGFGEKGILLHGCYQVKLLRVGTEERVTR